MWLNRTFITSIVDVGYRGKNHLRYLDEDELSLPRPSQGHSAMQDIRPKNALAMKQFVSFIVVDNHFLKRFFFLVWLVVVVINLV